MSDRLRTWPAVLRPSRRATIGILSIVGIAAAWGLHFGFWRYHLKRFTVVAPGVFYRVAQPTEWGLRHVVRRHGIRTLVSLQLFDFRLYRGLIDPGRPDGKLESEYAREIGLRHIQWPMGDEQCWPWPDPWELGEFFHLLDDPANRPVMIHCMGGRHRTGTFSALYRLEYDRWAIEPTLAEMYSYKFGLPVPAQERNLRTYVPRPLPTAEEWPAVAARFAADASTVAAQAVPVLAYRIRHDAADGPLRRAFVQHLAENGPFALALASRVIERTDDAQLAAAVELARLTLKNKAAAPRDQSAAAALIADFGNPQDQQQLLDLLTEHAAGREADPYYEALVCGVTNRYTPNRLAYMRPLLTDGRPRPAAAGLTYADTAAMRVAAATDGLPVLHWSAEMLSRDAPALATKWLDDHAESAQLSRLLPPLGRRLAQQGEGSLEEDLSKMRR